MNKQYLDAMTKNMTPAEAKKYRKFNRLCKEASKCREDRRQISCYACPILENCHIQTEIKKVQP